MVKNIKLKDKDVSYVLKKSKRAKRLRVAVCRDNGLVVVSPWFLPSFYIDNFLQSKADWILSKLNKLRDKPVIRVPRRHRQAYLKYKEEVRVFVHGALEKYNHYYNFQYNQVRIKNHKSRWGSCSEDGNLNFSYRLKYLPVRLAEYIVVHELCHLGELNHSPRFWQLVARTFPDHREIEKILRDV